MGNTPCVVVFYTHSGSEVQLSWIQDAGWWRSLLDGREVALDLTLVVLAAFLVGLAVTICAAVLAVLRAIALWRNAKRTGGIFTAELSSFEERAARTERLLAEAERSSAELGAALARLRVSRARLDVLLGSLEAAQRRTRWLRVLLPLR